MEDKSKKLIKIGIDVKSVVTRLGGNERLYLNICSKFTSDPNYRSLQEALSMNDYQSAEFRIHTLRGVAANLGFIRLAFISNSLLKDIQKQELTTLYQDNFSLSEEYGRIISVLNDENV